MPENAGAGLNVVQVEVKPPEDPKAIIRYKLDEIAEPYFVINERTGLIKTAGDLLDWEITPVITFPVYAYEIRSPNITGQTFVRVVVSYFINIREIISNEKWCKHFLPLTLSASRKSSNHYLSNTNRFEGHW